MMRTVAQTEDDNEEIEGNDFSYESMLRERAVEIIAKLFPGEKPTRHEIERVVQEIIIADENDTIVEDETKAEMEQLTEASDWAKKAWPHDGHTLSAALDAYDELCGTTQAERMIDLDTFLDKQRKKK